MPSGSMSDIDTPLSFSPPIDKEIVAISPTVNVLEYSNNAVPSIPQSISKS